MAQDDRSPVLPLAEETLDVSVRDAVTGRVRVSTITETFEEVVQQELQGMRADIARVSIDRTIAPGEPIPSLRTEGDVTIIPVLGEVIIIEKQLVLKEELHVTRSVTSEEIEVPVELRRQRAVIERLPATAQNQTNSGDENG